MVLDRSKECAGHVLDNESKSSVFVTGTPPDRDLIVKRGEQTEGVIMAKKSVEELIGRALTDRAFRDRLLTAPEATLDAEGYEATPDMIQAIKSADPEELKQVASGFESQLANRKAAS
jgi:hypothetical protein